MPPYTNYKVEKIHVYSRNGTELFGSADPYEVETASGAKEIHWQKPIPAADGEECTFWVQISTPMYKRLYFNQGTDDIIIAGTQYDLPVSEAQMPIFTPEDLRRIGSDAALFPMNEHYVLIRDIKLSGEWEPFGTNANNAFSGTLNGNYRTISELLLAGGPREYVGFFGYVRRATIKNLFLIISGNTLNLNTTTKQSIGILAAYAEDSVIQNITVRGGLQGLNIEKTAGASFRLGGIVGTVRSSLNIARISECACEINIAINKKNGLENPMDDSAYGGIAGLLFRDNAEGSFFIEKCYSSEAVSASSESIVNGGGIIGLISDEASNSTVDFLTISECYNSGDVSGEGLEVYCGGIIGNIKAKTDTTLPSPPSSPDPVTINMDKVLSMNTKITLSASKPTSYGIGRISGGNKYTPPISASVVALKSMILSPQFNAGIDGNDIAESQLVEAWYVGTMGFDFASTWEWNTKLKRPVFKWN